MKMPSTGEAFPFSTLEVTIRLMASFPRCSRRWGLSRAALGWCRGLQE